MKLFLSIFALLILSACQTTGTLTPLPFNGQKEMIRDGRQAMISGKKNIVSVSPSSYTVSDNGRISFLILITNGTKKEFEISTDNISAKTSSIQKTITELSAAKHQNSPDKILFSEFETATNAKSYLASYKKHSTIEEPIKVFSYDELVKEEEKRATAQAIAVALAGLGRSMQAANAGYNSGYGTYNAYNSYGGSTFGSYYYSGYDSAAAQATQNTAQTQTNMEFANASAQNQANLQYLKNTIFKRHTLMPGEIYGGLVQIQLPKFSSNENSIPIILDVTAGKENHSFLYKLTKNKKN